MRMTFLRLQRQQLEELHIERERANEPLRTVSLMEVYAAA